MKYIRLIANILVMVLCLAIIVIRYSR